MKPNCGQVSHDRASWLVSLTSWSVDMMSLMWFTLVLVTAVLQPSHGSSVNTSHRYATAGNHPVEVTCSYTIDDGESLQYLYIDTYDQSQGFLDLAMFWPDNDTAVYTDRGQVLENRTTLVMRGDSVVGLRFDVVECGDAAEYYCNLQTNNSYNYDWMQLFVKGMITQPKLLVTKSECFDKSEDLELACVGRFGTASGSFVWYGYHAETQTTTNLTDLADPGVPYRGEECSFKRTSHLKLDLTQRDQGLVIRCSSSEEDEGIVPSSDGGCDEYCDESLPVSFSEHPGKPDLSVKRTTTCQMDKVQFLCSGVVGSHEGHFVWFAYRPGQAPRTLTALKESTKPVKAYGSCGYRRESTLNLDLTKGDNGLVIRCAVHASFTARSPTAADPCGHLCVQSDRMSVAEKPKCSASVTSGVSEFSSCATCLLFSILLNLRH